MAIDILQRVLLLLKLLNYPNPNWIQMNWDKDTNRQLEKALTKRTKFFCETCLSDYHGQVLKLFELEPTNGSKCISTDQDLQD